MLNISRFYFKVKKVPLFQILKMEKSEENPIYNIQKNRQVNVLSTDYDYQSCQMIGGNNLEIKFDLLKLSSISLLIRKILASFGVPLFSLGSLDFIFCTIL